MTQRHLKVYGAAYSADGDADITLVFNGQQVKNGVIPTTHSPVPIGHTPANDISVLAEFDIDLSVTGNVPVELTVNSGSVIFVTIEGNYSGIDRNVQQTDPTVPIDPNNPATFTVISVTVAPIDFYGDLNINTSESDGKENVTIDGVAQPRVLIDPGLIGDWHYTVHTGSTLTCDLVIDPALITVEE